MNTTITKKGISKILEHGCQESRDIIVQGASELYAAGKITRAAAIHLYRMCGANMAADYLTITSEGDDDR